MKTKIRTIGNSRGCIIPSSFIRQLDLKDGSEVDVRLDGNKITITPIVSKQKNPHLRKVNYLTDLTHIAPTLMSFKV
ncbi:AbrB/MazE/SpoVT family DNA-binding domain-containing protein [Vibrio sp. S11_S32]|uniref:AbrB/MazE/SpoVT family DNA-binding domain-containing protein n=1 Tax=Vibrio sp. S11_S32 TaxID=2720225 RepID=UPI001EEEF1BA|nr:AbrB/MazE/SpoVT family DNA-binding domain-containing protein [Vibrio sp. S11_S32]